MKLLHIIPGSGDRFYCENCLRDNVLVRALHERGDEVTVIPLFLPSRLDLVAPEGIGPVFFGGINVHLQQQFALFRKTPRWLDKLFDARPLLQLAAARAGATKPLGLGALTHSMLRGAAGRQRKELAHLLAWLADQPRPAVVHVSNALLLGIGVELKRALRVPLVCSLQDEDTWLDALEPPYDRSCREEIAGLAPHADLFVAASQWYADRMRAYCGLAQSRVEVVAPGIWAADYEPPTTPVATPTIGFLSRLGPEQGLGRLVGAFLALRREPGLAALRLHLTGGSAGDDHLFVAGLRERLARADALGAVEFRDRFERSDRAEFLRSLSVLSVPVERGEAFGSFIIEALACAVPVVQPAVGAFPEVIAATGGGLLYDPVAADGLENALRSLLTDPARARELGARGRAAVAERYTAQAAAAKMHELYASLV